MSLFNYEAVNGSGKSISGIIEAETADKAEEKLSERGFIPYLVAAESDKGKKGWFSSLKLKSDTVTPADIIIFTKQFRTMFKAGVPMTLLLKSLYEQTQNIPLKEAVNEINEGIREGGTLYENFKKHPHIFSPLYVSLIQAGEVSGSMPEILSRLIYIIEHEHRINSDIKNALQYPKMVLFSLFIAFIVLLTFVVPKFVEIFDKVGLTLPLPTKIALFMYNCLSSYWYIILGAVIASFITFKGYIKTESGRYAIDTLFLRLPIVGELTLKACMSRFTSIFAILHSSGISILETIRIVSGTIGNKAVSEEFDHIKESLEEGKGIAGPLKSVRYFTPMVTSMMAIGEESGNLDEMLREVSIHYDDEIRYAVKNLSETLTPILIIGLTVVVGFFALAIFLPMWDLSKMVK